MEEKIKLSREEQEAVIRKVQNLESQYDSHEKENIQDAEDDLKMENGEQWTDEMLSDRSGRPTRTINKLSPPCKRIVNEFRQNQISIKVNPRNADKKEVALFIQGKTRDIEDKSNAKSVYSTAFDSAVRGSLGYYRIVSVYKDHNSFDQELKIISIPNIFAVKMDFRAKDPYGQDARWCIINDLLSHDEFSGLFPNSELANRGYKNFNYSADWVGEEGVKVAEFFEYRTKQETLYLLKNGKSVLASDFKGSKSKIAKERITNIPSIRWYKINAHEVLDVIDIPIPYIPVVRMPGEVVWIKEKRYFRSLIRFAKEPQRMYNVHKSNEQERDSLSPKAPYLVTEKQVEKYLEQWQRANVDAMPFLPYTPDPNAPPPQRQGYVNNSAGEQRLALEAAEDIKTTTGVYDPALGSQSNEVSGRAILARSGQSQTINFNFHDNAANAIRYGGLIIVSWMPHIYDGEREERILGDNGKEETRKINDGDKSNPLGEFWKDIDSYDVAVSTGPAYQTQMQEAFETLTSLLPQMSPAERSLALYKSIGNLSFPEAESLKKGLGKIIKMTMPNILDDEIGEGKQNKPNPEAELEQANQIINEMQNALQQTEQILQQQAQQIQALSDEKQKTIDLELVKHQLKMDEKEFDLAGQMKLKEMDSNQKIESALLADQLQKMSIPTGVSVDTGAPDYANQELEEQFQESEQPGLPFDQGEAEEYTQNLPAGSPGEETPSME